MFMLGAEEIWGGGFGGGNQSLAAQYPVATRVRVLTACVWCDFGSMAFQDDACKAFKHTKNNLATIYGPVRERRHNLDERRYRYKIST